MLRLAIAAVVAALLLPAADASARQAKPTIVLVHGAFADASGFGAVTDRLQDRGYTVISPANPLRGPASDAAYVASVMKTIEGPIVLVAHSYGGAVSTEAATQVRNVKALVYLNALALDVGETNLGITERFPNRFGEALRPRPFPQPDGTEGTDLYVDPASFHSLFAADVRARTAARMASAQRPVSLAASQEPSTEPAWKTIPSWYLIGRQDEVISPAAQRFMAKRAKAHAVEINSSHVSYISHPDAVTDLILRAARVRSDERPPCRPTLGEIVDESEPLIGAVPVYGPPVVLFAVPWLLFGLMLAGPFALLLTLVVPLVAVAALVALVGALLAAPYLLVARLRRRGVTSVPASCHSARDRPGCGCHDTTAPGLRRFRCRGRRDRDGRGTLPGGRRGGRDRRAAGSDRSRPQRWRASRCPTR